MSAVELESTLTCPQCAHENAEIMPTDACQCIYEGEQCHAVRRPLPRDWRVHCSYGSVACPPKQQQRLQSGAGRSSACCGWPPAPGSHRSWATWSQPETPDRTAAPARWRHRDRCPAGREASGSDRARPRFLPTACATPKIEPSSATEPPFGRDEPFSTLLRWHRRCRMTWGRMLAQGLATLREVPLGNLALRSEGQVRVGDHAGSALRQSRGATP